ncbi:MAG: hypothetical protein HYX65_03890 [Gemmatimonadetes bacterium]|nr:hypothetical protein [Gemmatimonadota bacterium]
MSGPGARIVIDFDVGRSLLVLESMPRQFVLIPWLRSVNDAATGHVSGRVSYATTVEGDGGGPAAGVPVTVMPGNPRLSPVTWSVAATGRTDAEGRYAINYRRDGECIVRFGTAEAPPGVAGSCLDVMRASVARRVTTTLDALLVPALNQCAWVNPVDTAGHGPGTSTVMPGGPVAMVTVHVWPPLARSWPATRSRRWPSCATPPAASCRDAR